MKVRIGAICALGLLFSTGCPSTTPTVDDGGTVGRQTANSGRPKPLVPRESIRVRFVSELQSPAIGRITMRVAGDQVFLSEREIAPGSRDVVAGPERADTVLVEVRSSELGPEGGISQLFTLGVDFTAGQEISVSLRSTLGNSNGNDNAASNANNNSASNANDNGSANDNSPPPPARELGVQLIDSAKVNAGTFVALQVVAANFADSGNLKIFADVDAVPASGNEIIVGSSLATNGSAQVLADTSSLQPGQYRIYGEAVEGETLTRSAPADQPLKINALPSVILDAPREGQLLTRGRSFTVAWAGNDADDDAKISIVLDHTPEGPISPDALILVSNTSENNTQDRDRVINSAELPAGAYYVRAVITDGLSSAIGINAPRLDLSDRLVGRWTLIQLGENAARITGDPGVNLRFGASLDASRDLNNDGFNDLLVGDPDAMRESEWGQVPVGAAYYHEAESGHWPASQPASDLRTTITAKHTYTNVGERVALLPPIDADPLGDIVIGAPFANQGEGGATGEAYFLNGEAARSRDLIFADELDLPLGTTVYGDGSEQLGLDVAALGDVNGDGYSDIGIGATVGRDGSGAAYIIAGGYLPEGSTDDVGYDTTGLTIFGADYADMCGAVIRGLADADGDGLAEILIAAPEAFADYDNGENEIRPGAVYLLFGDESLFSTFDGAIRASWIGSSVRGRTILGENDYDLAGASIASGDFDGDGTQDLLIGAPGANEGAGRAYLIYNIAATGDAPFINLADVGGLIPGVVFEALNFGDETATAVANVGDIDNDGIDDFVIGAPGAESVGGAYLIYGGVSASGAMSLGLVGTFDLPGAELMSGVAGEQFGATLSGGRMTDDPFNDMVVGAPGNSPGTVYIIYGRGAAD